MKRTDRHSEKRLSRRRLLRLAGAVAALSVAEGSLARRASARSTPARPTPARPAPQSADAGSRAADGPFTLPQLPYRYDALEDAIDARTMEIHHDRHHAGYVDGINQAVAGHPDLAARSIEEILRDIDRVPGSIRNEVVQNGGGHHNHSLFWESMSPTGGHPPDGALREAIEETFGGLDALTARFREAAMGRFGSGWAWLVRSGGALEVTDTANQDSPLMSGHVPLLGLDVWEHAYYLRYENRREDYVNAWWSVVDWGVVARRYANAA